MCAVFACAALCGTASALSWSDLWLRPDQRAQQLLNAGDAAAAAPLFDDPRRRGFAELRAQQFDAAAKHLQGLKDPESLYNRGNALAHAGDLKAALSAYDAALASAPKDGRLHKDAEHNRDLVAKQLQSQPPQSKQDPGKDKDKDKGKDGDKDQSPSAASQGDKAQPPQGDKNQPRDASDQNGQQPQQQPDQRAQQGQRAQQNPQAQQNAQSQQNPQSSGAERQQAGQPQNPKDGQQPGNPSSKNPDQPAPAADQAKQDSAAALADARAALQNRPPSSSGLGHEARVPDQASAVDDTPKPQTEQQLALEQWLRWIPDDPAGLLRRKFMIEHMLKQREEQP
jgi:Ca-activated chloride channel family protein